MCVYMYFAYILHIITFVLHIFTYIHMYLHVFYINPPSRRSKKARDSST
jgi:hypothetical protein